ncbi:MAG: GNAT family protein [Planctomycetota bacterium]
MNPGIPVGVIEEDLLRLEPLRADHAPALFEASDESCFRWWGDRPVTPDEAGMLDMVERHIEHAATLHYAVFERATGACLGTSSYLDIRPMHRGLEIGWTWITRARRGTWVNPAMKLLMLRHAFETKLFTPLGASPGGPAIRVQLKTHASNAQSRAAIGKIGARFEGVLRNHYVMPDGSLRDTAVYSITSSEWAFVSERLRARLARAIDDTR